MLDQTYTTNDLFAMTLDELGVMEPGQPISPEDVAPLKARWPSVLADLNARDVGWFDEDDIEDGERESAKIDVLGNNPLWWWRD